MNKLIFLFICLFTYQIANCDTLKYINCIAYNASYNKKTLDNNLYLYTNFYNKRNDYFIYLNYYDRRSVNDLKIKSLTWGIFYDFLLTKRLYTWSFYQGDKEVNIPYTSHQFAGGLGVFIFNNKNFYLKMNNGILYKNILDDIKYINEYRYNLRFSAYYTFGRCYIQTYNYFQPSFNNFNNLNFITFNTLTIKIYKHLNFKAYHWLNYNNYNNENFQYLIFGISIENWN